MECFRLLLEYLAWIEHQSLSGIRFKEGRESVRDDERCGRSKDVNTAEFIGQRVGLLCWGFKGVQGEIPWEEASGISTRTMHQSTTPSLSQTIWSRWASRQFLSLPIVQTLLSDFWFFPKLRGCRYETIEEMKEAVTKVIDTLTQEDIDGAFQKWLERYKCITAGGNYFEGD